MWPKPPSKRRRRPRAAPVSTSMKKRKKKKGVEDAVVSTWVWCLCFGARRQGFLGLFIDRLLASTHVCFLFRPASCDQGPKQNNKQKKDKRKTSEEFLLLLQVGLLPLGKSGKLGLGHLEDGGELRIRQVNLELAAINVGWWVRGQHSQRVEVDSRG